MPIARSLGAKTPKSRAGRAPAWKPYGRVLEALAFHKTRFFIDEQLAVPIRFEAYDWPAAAGTEPELVEEYTYHELRVNVGLGDRDFNYRNPDYGFPRSVKW